MTIDLLYFAGIREAIGCDGESVSPPEGVRTIADLVEWLAARGGGYAEALADRGRIRAAIGDRFADLGSDISGAAEIALFPPVTGG